MLDAKWSVLNESFIFSEIQVLFFFIWSRDIKIVIILTFTLKNGWRIVIDAWHLVNFLILSMYFWDAIFKGCLIQRNWYVVYLGGLTSSGYRYSFLSYTGRLRTCWPSFPQFSLFLNLKSISYTFPSLFIPRSDCYLTPPRKLKILRRFICLLNRSETKDLLRVNMRKEARENVACTDRKHHRKMSTHILLGENGS